jgi:hypothetical protein
VNADDAMTLKNVSFLLALALGGLIAAVSCVEPLEVEEAAECDGNRPPHIANLELVVDHWDDEEGWLIETPPEDSSVFISENDRIVLWFELHDADCNASGGEIYLRFGDDTFSPVTAIQIEPAEQLCQGMLINRFLGEDADDLDLPRGYGYEISTSRLENLDCTQHFIELRVTDACGKVSPETVTTNFVKPGIDC